MISSANSMKLGYSQDWSWSGYLSEVGIRVFLQLLSIPGYILQSDWCLVFGILNYRSSLVMLSIIGVFFIFSILAYSRRAIKYAVQLEFYYKEVISDQYYLASFKDLYGRKCRRYLCSDHYPINMKMLLLVIHILIGINHVHVPFVVHFTPYRNCEDAIFCKVDGM